MFEVYDINGNAIECELLFTFTENGKNFIVYLDNSENILASFYEVRDDKLVLSPITDEEDFDIVDKEIMKRRNYEE